MNMTIEPGSKLQFKLKILIGWRIFPRKDYFQLETEKVTLTFYLCVFELV